MNYQHAFHAGNFADVVKHVVLTRALIALTRKEAPLRYIDTHSGIGRYDLTSEAAGRSPEWRFGIRRVIGASRPSAVQELLEPYLTLMAGQANGVPLTTYLGSPAIAQSMLRRQDVIALCELDPAGARALSLNLGRDGRLRIAAIDGYVALNAYLPPSERRGLVLIDPPFEAINERDRLGNALGKALKKWPQGCFIVWRPIKDRRSDHDLLYEIKSFGRPNILNIEHDTGRVPPPGAELRRAGLVIVNPPYGVVDDVRRLLTYLTPLLARGDGAEHLCEWLTPPS